MPWNDNANPGPWGAPPPPDDGRGEGPGNGRGPNDPPPRRDPPRRPPPSGPDFEAWLARLRREAAKLFDPRGRGRFSGPRLIWAALGLIALVWLATGIYIVQPNQEAVITRFGIYSRSVEPGLHYHLPVPVEAAQLVSVTNQNKTVIGGAPGAEEPDESLMLTGDENIVDLSFTVQWHVSDAAQYLFNIRDPDAAVKAVAESSMREVVGRSRLTAIITNGRGEVQNQTATLMQRTLDKYQAGVTIDAVQIQNANPPSEVVPAYQDIARAGQDAQSYVNDANKYRNRVVNEAKGDAAKIIQAAEGYQQQVVKEAQGEGARFDELYAQYRKAPAVTKERLYIQSMQQILSHTHKVIVDAKGANAPIILPPDAFRSTAAASAAASPPAPAAPAPTPPAAAAAPASQGSPQ
jgi:membrane protease subunit HflK